MATRKDKFQSKAAAAIYEGVCGLYKCGSIDATKMREFDTMCLTPKQNLRIQERRKRGNSLDCHQGEPI